jgi:hypothetical protein
MENDNVGIQFKEFSQIELETQQGNIRVSQAYDLNSQEYCILK